MPCWPNFAIQCSELAVRAIDKSPRRYFVVEYFYKTNGFRVLVGYSVSNMEAGAGDIKTVCIRGGRWYGDYCKSYSI